MERFSVEQTTGSKSLLSDLVFIPSYKTNENLEKEKLIFDYLKSYFLSVKYQEIFQIIEQKYSSNGKNLIIVPQDPNNLRVWFLCHVDTVLPSDNNLEPKINGDMFFGLGAKDMKGGIASVLACTANLEDTELQKIGIVFYSDEEYEQKGMHALVTEWNNLHLPMGKILISPESRENLVTGGRGAIVAKIKIQGKRAHSARSTLGINAIESGFHMYQFLKKLFDHKKYALGYTSTNLVYMHGGIQHEKEVD